LQITDATSEKGASFVLPVESVKGKELRVTSPDEFQPKASQSVIVEVLLGEHGQLSSQARLQIEYPDFILHSGLNTSTYPE
jgi:hypothetical protein